MIKYQVWKYSAFKLPKSSQFILDKVTNINNRELVLQRNSRNDWSGGGNDGDNDTFEM